MKKSILSFLLIFTSLITTSYKRQDSYYNLEKALNQTGLNLYCKNFITWGKLNECLTAEGDIKSLGEDIANHMGLNNYLSESSHTKDYNKFLIKSSTAMGDINITVKNLLNQSHGEDETIVIIEVMQSGDNLNGDADAWKNTTMENALESLKVHGIDTTTSYCIVAYYDGHVKEGKREDTITKILKNLNARHIRDIDVDNLRSSLGYSNILPMDKKILNEKININVAYRYSKYENKSLFYIGTPVINLEY